MKVHRHLPCVLQHLRAVHATQDADIFAQELFCVRTHKLALTLCVAYCACVSMRRRQQQKWLKRQQTWSGVPPAGSKTMQHHTKATYRPSRARS
jgi:hypothetical protein